MVRSVNVQQLAIEQLVAVCWVMSALHLSAAPNVQLMLSVLKTWHVFANIVLTLAQIPAVLMHSVKPSCTNPNATVRMDTLGIRTPLAC